MLQIADKASGSGGLALLPKKEEWEAKEVDFLYDQKLCEPLPTSSNWPSLIALYLQANYELIAIPPLFFHRIALIQVLDLSGTNIKSLPKSLPKLVALKKLLLRCCVLFMELSPQVGELANLEELDLDQTQIMFLPRDVGKLIKLRYLRVSFYPICGKMKLKSNAVIHPETISNLSQLTDLSIDVDPADKRWHDSVEVVVKEVCNLKTLRTLSLYLPKFQLLDYLSSIYPSLSRFRFIVGQIKRRIIISRVPQEAEAEFRNWDKYFKFVNGENIPIEIKGVLRYSNSFFLDHHATAMNLSEFGIENMQRLKYCLLAECNKMETIIDGNRHCEGNEADQSEADPNSVENVVLRSLENLSIYYMENLRSIWRGPTRYGCMSKLKFLALHSCPQLSNVFSHSLLENLINLEELILEDCPLVSSLVSNAFVKPTMSYEFLPSLKRLLLLYLPELVTISNGLLIAPKLESIAFYNCPKLKSISKMELSSKALKIIKAECQWWEDIKWNETEWGNQPEYLMHIFSPINNEEDVMTQIAKDGFSFEAKAMIQNDGQQLDEKLLQVSTQTYKGQWTEYMEEKLIATDLTESTPSTPEEECCFSSDKNKRVEVEDDKINLASKICEVDEDEDVPKAKRNCTDIGIEGVISCEGKTVKGNSQRERSCKFVSGTGEGVAKVAFRTRNELLDDGYKWRKYGQKVIKGNPYPRSYYRCITKGCPAKKWVEQDTSDTSFSFVTYKGIHSHDSPYGKGLNNCLSQVCNDHGPNNMENAAEGAKAVFNVKKERVKMEDMPPEFRFYPTEEELVSFYLHNKLEGNRNDLNHLMNRVIPVVDIYEFNPWDLPQFSVLLCHKDPEQWFFFIPRQESEARGGRPKRLTSSGYWKATGSPCYVYSSNSRAIGVKRTMVFYNGRAPTGKKTEWKMNEYKAIEGEAPSSINGPPPSLRQEFSLCRVYKNQNV